jgi:hypothetical protein
MRCMAGIIATMEEKPFIDSGDICDGHFADKHRCKVKFLPLSKKNIIPINGKYERDFLRHFFTNVVNERQEWLGNPEFKEETSEDRELFSDQLRFADHILTLIEKDGESATITLRDDEMEFEHMPDIEREILMDNYKNENDEDYDEEFFNEELEIINYFLYIIHRDASNISMTSLDTFL